MIRQTVLILVLAPFCFLGDRNDPASVNPIPSGTGAIVSHREQTMVAEEFANRFGSSKSRGERANTKPTARFTMEPAGGVVGTVFTFDPTSSSDNESAIAWLSARYDWEDDGVYDTPWTNASQIIQHRFSAPGGYRVRLEIKDTGNKTDSTTRTLSVNAEPIHLPSIRRE